MTLQMKRGFLCVALGLTGCATVAGMNPSRGIPALERGAERVRIVKSDLGPEFEEVGLIEVIDGEGCGYFGSRGTFQGVYNLMKNRAADIGADYVEIMTWTEPHTDNGCFDNRFVARGVGFKWIAPEKQKDKP